jgi:acyl-coenzyme A thioesterase PaaI-like protein
VNNPHGLKMKFYTTAPGEVTCEYRAAVEFQSYPGTVHGGIIASMLDEVTGRSLMPVDGTRFMVTASLNIRYRKPVPVETLLRLVGRAGKDSGKIARATGFIFGPEGELLAEAEAVLVDIPEGDLARMHSEEMGWRVYPDEELRV